MKVRDLIKELNKFDKDKRVIIVSPGVSTRFVGHVKMVRGDIYNDGMDNYIIRNEKTSNNYTVVVCSERDLKITKGLKVRELISELMKYDSNSEILFTRSEVIEGIHKYYATRYEYYSIGIDEYTYDYNLYYLSKWLIEKPENFVDTKIK